MKTSSLLLFAGLLGVAACSKDKSDAPQPAPGSANSAGNVLSATVGSSPFQASGTSDVDGTRVAVMSPDEGPARLVLRGRSGNNDITLSLVRFTGTGTYTVLPAGPNVASYSEGTSSATSYNSQFMPGTAAVGQVVVTSWDPATRRIQGSFSFSGRPRISSGSYGPVQQVTAGSFTVSNVFSF
ncbi:hypothetical protein GCM10023185_02540 [Hymenobacter saemangeumensis]|uniref:Lipoprotein n=1 Tax=Hymenobacter saemangeumensis TaxID=1084522 RepID=A0ABP8HYI9_9BACT